MPRYCFHIYDGLDHHGHWPSDLADLEAARAEARRCLGDMLKEKRDPPARLDVCDKDGLTLVSMYYAEIDAPVALGPPAARRQATAGA